MTMDYRSDSNSQSMEAAGAIRVRRLVKVSGNHTIAECDGEEISVGVSMEAATAAGDIIQVQIGGIAKVQAGGTITIGQFVNADADGKAVAETSTNKWVSGIALNAAVDGDFVSILIVHAYLSSS